MPAFAGFILIMTDVPGTTAGGAAPSAAPTDSHEFTSTELRTLLESSSDLVIMLDRGGRYLKVSPNNPQLLYRPANELLGRNLHDVFPGGLADYLMAGIEEALFSQQAETVEYALSTGAGERSFNAKIIPVDRERVMFVARDITDHRAADSALAQRFEIERMIGRLSTQFININPDRIDGCIDQALHEMGRYCDVDRAYVYLLVDNHQFMVNTHSWRREGLASRLGYGKRIPASDFPWLMEKLRAREVIRIQDLREMPHNAAPERATFASRGVQSLVVVPIVYSDELRGFIGFDSVQRQRRWPTAQVHFLKTAGEVFASALQRKQSEEKIYRLAYYDHLTGLPNRILLRRYLQAATGGAREPFALVLLDLDDSSMVNDLFGHDIGDQLLRHLSARLEGFRGENDTLARWGGDEFMLTVADPGDRGSLCRRITQVQSRLAEPLSIGDHELRLSCCAGVARFPEDAETVDGLVRFAEMALHQAKQKGRGSLQVYSSQLKEKVARRNLLESKLRRALDKGEFTLHYQPLICGRTGRILSAEALLRWRDADLGMVRPDHFIPLAEDIGLIVPIGEWVLETACAEMAQWRKMIGEEAPRIAVNVSAHQLFDDRLAATVEHVLDHHELPAGAIELEITESTLMEREKASLPLLQRFRELGVGVAIDDFGTGYSSLSKIKHLPINVLKIDRSFIKDIFTDDNDKAIVIAVVAMAHQLQLSVVAEGVETPEQLAFLRANGCDIIQGYIYSRPVPAEEFRQLLGRGPMLEPE